MSALFSTPPKPPSVPVPPPIAAPATAANPAVAQSGANQRTRAAAGAAAQQQSGTPEALQPPQDAARGTLLGGGR